MVSHEEDDDEDKDIEIHKMKLSQNYKKRRIKKVVSRLRVTESKNSKFNKKKTCNDSIIRNFLVKVHSRSHSCFNYCSYFSSKTRNNVNLSESSVQTSSSHIHRFSFAFTNNLHSWNFLMKFYAVFLVFIISLLSCFVQPYGMSNMSPRVVLTKQAQFQGFLGPRNVRFNAGTSGGGSFSETYNYRTYGHPVVEIFKGIPYASPPVESLRYESPVPFPLKSNEVFSANITRPACPRFFNATVDQLSNLHDQDPLRAIKKLHQLEDCLYLDIYAPLNTKKNVGPGLPVLVYANSQPDDIHDPFDGSSMAAIGQIIIVSFRYRVGVVGFLQPSYAEEVRSNFGLWDQLAALQWIRENINAFGGDENNVSLMGNDLDATLISVLALSPLSQAYGGLFHRLILLNGSPFSPISINHRPLETTVHLSNALQCSLNLRSNELLNCLRHKPITHLLAAAQTMGSQILSYHFAPSVDGTIVNTELASSTTINPEFPKLLEILSRYDILCGLGEGPVLPNIGVPVQFWQNLSLDKFVTAAIKLALDMDLGSEPTSTLKQAVIRAIKNEYGDLPLMRELVSDYLMINPMIQLLNKHSETGKNTYFFVSKNYDPLHKKKHSEIPYIFGNDLYHWKYVNTDKPKDLYLYPFEAMISLIANFVQSGDPNRRDPKDRLREPEKSWPKYKRDQGRYLKFGRDVDLVSKYRQSPVTFWSQEFPALLKQYQNGIQDQAGNDGGGNGQFPTHFGKAYPFNITHIYPTGGIDSSSTTVATTSLAALTENTVVIIGGLLLLLNLLCFMGLFYQRQRLKRAETHLLRKFNLTRQGQPEGKDGEGEPYDHDDDHETDLNARRKRQVNKTRNERDDIINGENQRMLELDSTESEPYQIAHSHHHHQHPNPNLSSTPSHHISSPPQQRLSGLQQQQQQPLDALSETETDNGFGPNFLGPNYDPRTKVSRWMFQQQANTNGTSNNGSKERPSPPPIELELRQSSSGGLSEPIYHPYHTHPHHHHYHPHHSTLPQPVHIHINTNSRQLPTPPIQTGLEYIPMSPYQPLHHHPYHPIAHGAGSDIPYADSRATSPSITNYNPPQPVVRQQQQPATVQSPNSSTPNYNNSSIKRVVQPSTSIINSNNNNNNNKSSSSDESPTLLSCNDYESITPSTKRSSAVLVNPVPVRNSIIIRELEPNTDEVESSAPRTVQIKSNVGSLKRSVGVGSSENGNGNSQPTENANYPSTISNNNKNNHQNPNSSFTRVVQGPSTSTTSTNTTTPSGTVIQKVTFADGL